MYDMLMLSREEFNEALDHFELNYWWLQNDKWLISELQLNKFKKVKEEKESGLASCLHKGKNG